MQKQEHAKLPTDKNDRRRGRPAGKNRVPLSLAERRARNAQYERERRNETAEAMAELAEATCCDPIISNPELLATVIQRLQSAQNEKPSSSIEDLRRINQKLESQIAVLQSRLESNSESQKYISNIDSDGSPTSKYESDSDTESSQSKRPSKYKKTAKGETVHDSAKLVRQSETTSRRSESSSDSQDSTWPYQQLGNTIPPHELLLQMSDVQLFPDSVSSLQRTESIPEQVQNNIDQSDQPKMSYMDPFTEREKGILESLGCSDYINFEDHHNETSFDWLPDYDGYLTGY